MYTTILRALRSVLVLRDNVQVVQQRQIYAKIVSHMRTEVMLSKPAGQGV